MYKYIVFYTKLFCTLIILILKSIEWYLSELSYLKYLSKGIQKMKIIMSITDKLKIDVIY